MSVDTKITLSLTRENLLHPLQVVTGVIEKKQTLPILANVLCKFSGNQLSITGTDLEVEMVGRAKLENAVSDVEFTLPGRKLLDIVRALPESSDITLSVDTSKVILTSNRSRFTLSSLPASDFPTVETLEKHLQFNIPQNRLLTIIQHTYFSMAQQDVRYYLNGLLIEASQGLLQAVATDGHRLATYTSEAPISAEHRLQIILPRKAVIELTRILETSENEVCITIGGNNIKIESEGCTFTSKLIEGRFPDYQRVIPKNSDKHITLEKSVLKNTLQRAAILCNEKFRGVRFELKDNTLKISANNPEHETAEEEININYTDTPLDIGFNVNYLIDILNVISSDTVTLSFTSAESSILIEQSDNKNGAYVVMPMRL